MKIGDGVKQIVHPVEGIVSRKQYDEVSDGFIYQVDYAEENGEITHRWFKESEIEIDSSYVAPVFKAPVTKETIEKVGV